MDVVEGQTSPLDFQFRSTDPVTGLTTNPNLTGATVTLILKQADGTTVDTAGDISAIDASVAKYRYTPDAGDFMSLSPKLLTGRWQVVLGGETSFFPSGAPDHWRVWKP